MNIHSKTAAYYQKVRYDIYCPLATIAEHMHDICSYYDNISNSNQISTGYNSSVDGSRVSFSSPQNSLIFSEKTCIEQYRWTIESLGKLFRTELDPADYPVSQVRVHIRYRHSDIARFIYDHIDRKYLDMDSETKGTERFSDISMEDEETIGVTCGTLEATAHLWKIFIGAENSYYAMIDCEERIARYNNDNRLEDSTHSMITSICLFMMIFGLMAQCSA